MSASWFRTLELARVGVLIAASVCTMRGAAAKQPHDPNPPGAIESLSWSVEVERPMLKAAVAEEVAALEARIDDLKELGLAGR